MRISREELVKWIHSTYGLEERNKRGKRERKQTYIITKEKDGN